MAYPKKFENLLEHFKKFPGIGEKNAERFVLNLLNMNTESVHQFAKDTIDAYEGLHPCKICGHITDQDICPICVDKDRNQNTICVIEDYKSVFSFEKVGNYQGVYHVLNGLISPMEGVGVEDINLASLIERVEKLENPELILALKSSVEGETTTLYIKKIFEGQNVTISRLSYGIPMGAEIDYIDTVTLDKALIDRKKISE